MNITIYIYIYVHSDRYRYVYIYIYIYIYIYVLRRSQGLGVAGDNWFDRVLLSSLFAPKDQKAPKSQCNRARWHLLHAMVPPLPHSRGLKATKIKAPTLKQNRP